MVLVVEVVGAMVGHLQDVCLLNLPLHFAHSLLQTMKFLQTFENIEINVSQ